MKDSERPQSTRDAILEATDRLLARYGYKKMTIDDLAKEVGIGKGSIYLHFSSKDEIALSHIDRIVERLKVRLDATAKGGGSAEQRVRKMMIERVLFRFDSVQHYTQSLSDLVAHLRPQFLERRQRYFEEEARVFAAVIKEGQNSGEFVAGHPLEAARALLDATNSLLPYSLSTYELGERGELEKKTKRIADLILNGLKRNQ